jgi:excisionase family DNA binding protein
MTDLPEILTLEQAAAFLQVSPRTLQRMLKENRLPGRQVGSQWRFDREQLRAWVRGEHVAELEAAAQRDLIERERARLCVDLPETLVDMQQEAVRRHAARSRERED